MKSEITQSQIKKKNCFQIVHQLKDIFEKEMHQEEKNLIQGKIVQSTSDLSKDIVDVLRNSSSIISTGTMERNQKILDLVFMLYSLIMTSYQDDDAYQSSSDEDDHEIENDKMESSIFKNLNQRFSPIASKIIESRYEFEFVKKFIRMELLVFNCYYLFSDSQPEFDLLRREYFPCKTTFEEAENVVETILSLK